MEPSCFIKCVPNIYLYPIFPLPFKTIYGYFVIKLHWFFEVSWSGFLGTRAFCTWCAQIVGCTYDKFLFGPLCWHVTWQSFDSLSAVGCPRLLCNFLTVPWSASYGDKNRGPDTVAVSGVHVGTGAGLRLSEIMASEPGGSWTGMRDSSISASRLASVMSHRAWYDTAQPSHVVDTWRAWPTLLVLGLLFF